VKLRPPVGADEATSMPAFHRRRQSRERAGSSVARALAFVLLVLVAVPGGVAAVDGSAAQQTTTDAAGETTDGPPAAGEDESLPSWTVFAAAIVGFGFLVLFRRYFGPDEMG